MPVLLGFGFPEILGDLTAEESNGAKAELVTNLREAVASVDELKIGASAVSVFMPQEQVTEGLGQELIVQITGLYETSDRTDSVLHKLSTAVALCLRPSPRSTCLNACTLRHIPRPVAETLSVSIISSLMKAPRATNIANNPASTTQGGENLWWKLDHSH